MNTNIDFLENLPDEKPVRIFLPITGTQERLKGQCVYQKTVPPRFNLLFQPGILPVDEIDLKQSCLINIDVGGPTVSLEAHIVKIENTQILQMNLVRSVNHDQLREFFRVDAHTEVTSSSSQQALGGINREPWTLRGHTVDLSGSGVLTVFDQRPPDDHQVRLEITLPTGGETVTALAHQVRVTELGDGRVEVAYHFDEIEMEDRDKIIGSCLVLQRRMLRLKVQVRQS